MLSLSGGLHQSLGELLDGLSISLEGPRMWELLQGHSEGMVLGSGFVLGIQELEK